MYLLTKRCSFTIGCITKSPDLVILSTKMIGKRKALSISDNKDKLVILV